MATLDFPSSPNDGDIYSNFIYDAAKGAWKSLSVTGGFLSALNDVEIVAPQDGDMIAYSGSTSSWKNTYNHFDSLQLTKTTNAFNDNYTIPSGYNGTMIGPVTVGEFAELTISADSILLIFQCIIIIHLLTYRRKMSSIRVDEFKNLSNDSVFDASSGTVILAPGTTTKAPLQFQAGPSLTTPVAGSIEFNGNTFLTTSSSVSGKAFNDDSLFYGLNADRTITPTVVASTFYSIFGVGIAAPSDGSYVFDIMLGIKTGATSHTVAFRFGGTATILDAQYRTEFTNLALSSGTAAPGTPTAATTLCFQRNPDVFANAVVSPASTLTSKFLRVHGMIETSGSGTINPEIAFSANPTGTNAISKYSYARFNSLGTVSGDLIAGNWS